jgi:hypothetical protein
MTTPSTSIYVRPGATSTTWTYNGTSDGASAITSVAFSLDGSLDQQVARGNFQYSLDNGKSWTAYVLQVGTAGTYMPAAGTLWRFVDQSGADTSSTANFTMSWKLADGSVVTNSGAAVVPDLQPVGLLANHNTVLSNLHAGDFVAALNPIDTGDQLGGKWVIESQSQPGLFKVSADPATGAASLVMADASVMPADGGSATVQMHYYDRYQLDPTSGTPFANTGVSDTLVFSVLKGSTQDLAAFGADLSFGAAGGQQASPAVASLSTGGFVTVWQGSGADIWAQVHDASGVASGAPFAITATGAAAAESEPAVSALLGGGFVVAYTLQQDAGSEVAWRVVGANGSVGQQFVASSAGDASMATVATLSDGSFVLGWRSGGQVHLEHVGANGVAIGGEQVVGTIGTAFSPSVTALHNGDYVVSWGELGDGNVYAALGSSPGAAPIAVTYDGAAASISTAAPLPHVTALAGGGFVVAWDSYSNDQFGFAMSDIFFQRYDNAGHALGAIGQANLDSGSGRYDASVAALPDGGFVIGWQAQGEDGDGSGVFGRRFGADGTALDAHEFQVNQMSQGDQANPALAVLDNGGIVTTWTDTQLGASTIEARVLAGSSTSTASGHASDSGSMAPALPASSGTVAAPAPSGSTGGTVAAPAPSTSTGGSVASPAPMTSTGASSVVAPKQGLAGTSAADVFHVASGAHAIDGGAGLDTVAYQGAHSGFTVHATTSGFTVTGGTGAVQDTLVGVERLQFSDASVALDINGTAGEAYRLYQAAFDRAPDADGLGYWIKMMDNGQTLQQVAAGFVASQEFASLYGPNASDSQFVNALYQNVLHRAGEAAGYNFWMAALEQHGASRATVLGSFSESAENQAQVIGSIHDGILFHPWG